MAVAFAPLSLVLRRNSTVEHRCTTTWSVNSVEASTLLCTQELVATTLMSDSAVYTTYIDVHRDSAVPFLSGENLWSGESFPIAEIQWDSDAHRKLVVSSKKYCSRDKFEKNCLVIMTILLR